MSTNRDEWATPQATFDALDDMFNFTWDVCATPDNAKCAQFFTIEDDALTQPWVGVCWMNPPYSELPVWLAKAQQEAERGATIVALVPARPGSRWWMTYCEPNDYRFLSGRQCFVMPDGSTPGGAPFPSAVVVFRARQHLMALPEAAVAER